MNGIVSASAELQTHKNRGGSAARLTMQGASGEDEQMARLHLIVGPVGAGKSTFAAELSREHRAVRLTLDEWMTHHFSPDRPDDGVIPWYVERAARCVDQIWRVALAITETGTDVILEIGLLQAQQRTRIYRRADEAGLALAVYVIDAPRELRRARVARRNQERGATFTVVVPPAFFELASDMWEPPDDAERAARGIQWRDTWSAAEELAASVE